MHLETGAPTTECAIGHQTYNNAVCGKMFWTSVINGSKLQACNDNVPRDLITSFITHPCPMASKVMVYLSVLLKYISSASLSSKVDKMEERDKERERERDREREGGGIGVFDRDL